MNDTLVVTETMRFPYRRHLYQMHFLRAKIYLLDWKKKQVIHKITSPKAFHIEEFSSLERSYHYHGARGVTSNGKYIFIAAQNVVLVFDKNLKLSHRIHNTLFNGIHEIYWHRERLYVTCAVTDAILVLNEKGDVKDTLLLGDNEFFTDTFDVQPRKIDIALDYRVMHLCRRRFHVNSVCVRNGDLYAGFNFHGAFVRIRPPEEVLIHNPKLKNCHNAQFSPNGEYILINDTQHYSLNIYDPLGHPVRSIDLRKFGLPIRFGQKTIFGDGHQITAGWLRGLAFSVADREIAYIGLSPTCIVAVNYVTGELQDYMKLRKNIWITVHGIHNIGIYHD